MVEKGTATSKVAKSIRAKARRAAVPERGVAITPEERRRMIAESAYYRAERRGFRSGGEEQDWLEAEAEVDQMLITGKKEV